MKYLYCFLLLFLKINSFSQEQFVVYFDSDKYELTKTEIRKLNDWMTLHGKDKIVAINGYTDEDGSNSYNDTLAKKRVHHVFEILKEKVPFREDFKSRNFGENFNQAKNKAENRKVTIFYIEEKNLAYENEILGIEKPKSESIGLVDDEVISEKPISNKLSLEEQISNAKVGSIITIENINFHLNSKEIVKECKFSELTENDKKTLELHYLRTIKSVIKVKVSSADFNDFKNSKNYAVWIDGNHIQNSELDKYNETDFVHFFNSFVHKNARSKKFPQEHQVSLYTEEGFKLAFSKKAEIAQPSITLLKNGDSINGIVLN